MPKIKNNRNKLNSILCKAPKMIGLKVEAMVPAIEITPLPIPTILDGNS